MSHCYTKHVECPDISCSECNIKVRKEMVNMNLKTELEQMGFKSAYIEDNNSSNIYVKVWFDYEMDCVKYTDGRQEFYDIGNSEETLNYIVQWIKKEGKGFNVIL